MTPKKAMNKENLKIQLRAVPYANESRVLEYRIDPNQNITYEKEPTNFFERILKKIGFKFIRKYNTKWERPSVFSNPLTMAYYEFYDEFNWGPIWCDNQDSLNYYKRMFKTYKDICDYITEVNIKGHERWEKERAEYLNKRKVLY